MDSDQGKLFIGGIAWVTTEEKLKEHFGSYGEVSSVVIMKDKLTSRPRGFGFVGFADPSVLDRVLQDSHTIDGRTVEAKRALSREEQQTSGRSGNNMSNRSGGGGPGANMRTKKIFVGGLPPTLTEDGFRQYFQTFGTVSDVVVMYDQNTQRPRGFGFVTFESEDSVDEVLQKTYHELDRKFVEVKRALPKEANANAGGGWSMTGGSYQSYGGSGGNNSYDGRMGSNRYMQPQAVGGGFPPYGSSGYGAPGYGYGAPTNVGGYGGYGSATAGYGVQGGAYVNHNAGNVSGQPGARSQWNSQPPAGYGSAGYGGGSTGYGAATNWNAQTGNVGSGAVPIGQSPNGAAGYGNQAYGYGGYGGSEGAYGYQSGYGSGMGRGSGGPGSNPAANAGEQAGSYMTSGYGDSNGSAGYANAWNSNP